MGNMKTIKLSDLTLDPNNANRGTVRGQGLLEKSLQDLGAGRSVLADKHGVLIAGNKTLQTAIESGFENAIVVESDGTKLIVVKRTDLDLSTDEKAKLLAIADNRVGEISLEWNPEVLAELSQEVDLSGFFFPDELDALLASEPPDPIATAEEDEATAADLIEKAESGELESRVKLGEVWALGRHRLIVGDSTDKATIECLMNGTKASMCWTDPPYNVDYDPEARASVFSSERLENKLGKIENDKLSDDDFRAFLDQVYTRINESIGDGCPIYISHADTMGHHFRNAFVAQPWRMQSCLIWKKSVLVFGRADYHWMHEPILYGWKEGSAHKYYGDRKQTTVLEHPSAHYDKGNCDTKGYLHPTQKPTPLIKQCLQNSSQQGDIVLDLFGGSGSTLIACQNANRIAYLSELDTRFATVIIERYEAFTGQTATLVGNL